MASIVTREGKKGTRFVARVRVVGHPPQVMTFERKSDAKTWAAKVQSELKSSRAFPERRHARRTLGELIEHYRAEGLPPSCAGAYGPHLDWWAERLGGCRLMDVRPELIARLREQLSREPGGTGRRRGPTTVNRYLNTLSAVFSFGASSEVGWIDDNPVRRVGRKLEPRGRERFLSRPIDEPSSELERLLDACRQSRNPDLFDLVLLALLTGMRESEILCLRRTYVRLHEGGISLPAEVTKTGEPRFVPLVGEALELVRRRVEGERDFLFGNVGRRSSSPGHPVFPRKAWNDVLRQAQIENFKFHDLRHTHASYLAMLGTSTRELMDALGHKTPDMAARYSHLANLHKREVAQRLLGVADGIFADVSKRGSSSSG